MTALRVLSVTLDRDDPDSLAAFYSRLLDLPEAYATPDRSAIALSGPGFLLGCLRVAGYQPPTWPDGGRPKQIHLDLDSRDLDADTETAVSLGATLAADQPNPEHWRVLLDPAGHPFCLTTSARRQEAAQVY